jgi:uncharacterized protein YbdZ (MbtH family)
MAQHDSSQEDNRIYKVVINREEQYSIWPADREIPLGWTDAGKSGLKADCLAYIKEVWVDLRPLSLRKQMEEWAQRQAEEPPQASTKPSDEARGDDLVKRLSTGQHAVEIGLRPEKSVSAFKERLEQNFIHIKFTDTRGGTELGMKLDRSALDLGQADFEKASGTVHLEGDLSLDLVNVRCIADIDLQTLTGQGYLVTSGG